MFTLSKRLFTVDNVDDRTRMMRAGCGVLEAQRKRDMVGSGGVGDVSRRLRVTSILVRLASDRVVTTREWEGIF